LIDPSNHFICLLIDDSMDGGGTTTQGCLTSPPKQSKAKFDVTKCNKIILEQKFKANKKIIMGQREYLFRGSKLLQNTSKVKILILIYFLTNSSV